MLESLLIIAVCLLFFWRTLDYHYVSDDIPVCNRTEHQPSGFWHGIWLQFKGYRYFNLSPTVKNPYDWYCSPKVAHIITLSIHIVNCVLIYWAFGHNHVSLLASLLFAINPINCQGGSIWLSGKPYSCATTCALLMYLIPIAAPLPYYASTFFSANAMLAPLPFLLTRWWWWGGLPLVMYVILRRVVMKKWDIIGSTNYEMTVMAPRKLITACKTFGYYFRICLVPYKLGLYHPFLWGLGVNATYNKQAYRLNKDFWIGLGIGIASGVTIVLNYNNLLGFGLLWFCINIAMFSNFVTIQQQIGERYVYLANCGLMLALAYIVSHFQPLSLVFLGYYATRLWYYRKAFENDYWQVEYNVIDMPDAHYAWVAKGVKKFFMKDYDGSLRDFAEAKQYVGHDFKCIYNLGVMFLCLGDIGTAEKLMAEAEQNFYDGVADIQRKEFTDHTRTLIEQAKKEGKIEFKYVRVIK